MNNNLYYVNRNRFNNNFRRRPNFNNDERFGFLGPFLLGGITGGLVAPLFYQRPYYQQPYYQPPYYTNNYYYQYPPYYY